MRISGLLNRARVVPFKIYQHWRYITPYTKRNKKFGPDPAVTNIAVFSSPRGGSTWMGELMCRLPQSFMVFEPLFIEPPYPELEKTGMGWNPFIPDNANWPSAEEYFRALFSRQIGSLRSLRIYYHNDISKIASAKYFIFKEVNSTMLLPWLSKKFPLRSIYVVRHPCAVIASQLQYKHWDFLVNNPKYPLIDDKQRFPEHAEKYKHLMDSITMPEERLAIEWCLHNSVPLLHSGNDKDWITVHFEHLFQDPASELTRIFARLNLPMPDDILDHVRVPSITAIDSSVSSIKQGTQLSSWMTKLSKQQVANILRVVREFGIEEYDQSPLPVRRPIERPN